MNGRAIGAISAAALVGAAIAAPGADAAGLRFAFAFGGHAPGVATTARVDVGFPTDDQGRPKQLKGLDFEFPDGTTIDRSVAPVCTASDDQVNSLGDDACPAETQVGWGSAEAHTGFGPPLDPFPSDAHTFATPTGTLNVFTPQGLRSPTVWRTRQVYDGLWVRDIFPAPAPGFPPPDGKSLPLEAHFTLDRRAPGKSWLTTPTTCPTEGAWTAHVVLTFVDGSVNTASTTTPCQGTRAQRAARTRARPRAHRRRGHHRRGRR
jgi:hypothetical protein